MAKCHTPINLNPPLEKDETSKTSEAELSSDFLQFLTVRENTGLYRAQVAVEGGTCTNEHDGKTKVTAEKTSDPVKLKASRCGEFHVKRPDDKKNVLISGILTLGGKVIVCDASNNAIKLFDQKGNFLSSVNTYVKYMRGVWGLTNIGSGKFATCEPSHNSKVCVWALQGETIVFENTTYDVCHKSNGIHFNGTYYAVLHHLDNAITVLDTQGKRVRKIVLIEAFGKKITFSFGIHMDSVTHNICVSCQPGNSGVLCVSAEGTPLWFTPLSGQLCGVTEINDLLCIADMGNSQDNGCVYLMAKKWEDRAKLLDKDSLVNKPSFMYYDTYEQILYLSFFETDVIRMFHVNY